MPPQPGSPAGGAASAPLAIELSGISKSFGAVQANRDIHLAVRRGTIHGTIAATRHLMQTAKPQPSSRKPSVDVFQAEG